MAKRKTHTGDGPHAGKRQKTNHVHEAPTSEEVYNSRQLRQLLAFQQDMKTTRHGTPAPSARPSRDRSSSLLTLLQLGVLQVSNLSRTFSTGSSLAAKP